MSQSNAELGFAFRDILAPRDDESEIAAKTLSERELNPQHRQVLKLKRGLQLSGVDRLEADICDNAQHDGFVGASGPATNIAALPSAKRG